MNFDWQNLVVLLLVVAAGGYVARLMWQTVARKSAAARTKSGTCGGCGTCPASAVANLPQVFEMPALEIGRRPSRDVRGEIGR